MRRRFEIVLMAVLAAGCAAKTLPTEPPLSVSPLRLGSGEVRATDQVIAITDASGTMYHHGTFPLAKALTRTFVAAMPDRDVPAARRGGYEAGSIGFGGNERSIAPLAPFDRASLARTAESLRVLGEIGGWGGRTPYHDVLAEARIALAGKRGVEFEFDSAELTGTSAVVLDAAAEELRKCPNIAVRVEGHTDAVGGEA